jgi:hypothetical protein
VGDADNFRLYHTPGFGWRGLLKFRHVPPITRRGAQPFYLSVPTNMILKTNSRNDAGLKGKTIHIRLAAMDAPEVSEYHTIPYQSGLPPSHPSFSNFPIPICAIQYSTNSPPVFTVVRYRSFAYYYHLLTGTAFRSSGAAQLHRRARMAQREHRRSQNQVRAPQTRSVRTRRCPSAPPAHLLALAPVVDIARRCQRNYHCHHTQSPPRDDPRRVGRRVYTERSGVR